MTKIELNDTIENMIEKMSEGNPGEIAVLCDIIRKTPQIDPQNFMGGMGLILDLDTNEIYGSRIWMLFKDVCNENIVKTICVIRAAQLGIISKKTLDHAIDNMGNGLDMEELLKQVKERIEIKEVY